jgi:hypothetical protein
MGLNPFTSKREQQQEDLGQLRWLTRLAREDLVELGERLEDEAPPAEEGALAERELARGLTADARPRLREAETPEAVLEVQGTLGQAFVHLARADAIVRGEEPPTRTDPCAFNPQHGPAAIEVEWTPIGGERATYACCRPDADLIAAGKTPRFRQIKVGSVTVAWQDLHRNQPARKSMRLDVAGMDAMAYQQAAVSLSSIKNIDLFSGGRP